MTTRSFITIGLLFVVVFADAAPAIAGDGEVTAEIAAPDECSPAAVVSIWDAAEWLVDKLAATVESVAESATEDAAPAGAASRQNAGRDHWGTGWSVLTAPLTSFREWLSGA